MVDEAVSARRKQFLLDSRIVLALQTLARDRSVLLDSLADEAFRDLLKKHRRPVTIGEALRDSVRTLAANDREPRRKRAKP